MGWKNAILTDSVNSHYKKAYSKKILNLKMDYSSIINDLKQKILFTEKNISLVEQKHSEISFILSKNLSKAVSSLNKKILDLNNDDLQNFKVEGKVDTFKTIQKLDQKFEKEISNEFVDFKNNKTQKLFK